MERLHRFKIRDAIKWLPRAGRNRETRSWAVVLVAPGARRTGILTTPKVGRTLIHGLLRALGLR